MTKAARDYLFPFFSCICLIYLWDQHSSFFYKSCHFFIVLFQTVLCLSETCQRNFLFDSSTLLVFIDFRDVYHRDKEKKKKELHITVFTSAVKRQAHLIPSGSVTSNSKYSSCLGNTRNMRILVDREVRSSRSRIGWWLNGNAVLPHSQSMH